MVFQLLRLPGMCISKDILFTRTNPETYGEDATTVVDRAISRESASLLGVLGEKSRGTRSNVACDGDGLQVIRCCSVK